MMNRYITLNDDNIVVSVRFFTEIARNEIENDIGQLGQLMLADGTFEYVVLPLWEQQFNKYTTEYEMVLDGNSFTAKQFLEYTGEVFIEEV